MKMGILPIASVRARVKYLDMEIIGGRSSDPTIQIPASHLSPAASLLPPALDDSKKLSNLIRAPRAGDTGSTSTAFPSTNTVIAWVVGGAVAVAAVAAFLGIRKWRRRKEDSPPPSPGSCGFAISSSILLSEGKAHGKE